MHANPSVNYTVPVQPTRAQFPHLVCQFHR